MTSIPRSVEVRMEGLSLEGILNIPEGAQSIVLFAHGSGSSRQPGATHLFEETGALQSAATSASAWFRRYLPAAPARAKTAPRTPAAPTPAAEEARHAHPAP